MTGTATQTLDRTPDIDPIDPAADVAGRLDGVTVAARQARSLAQQAGRLTLENLPGRDLDPDELVELASSVASDPGPLAPHIAFSDDKRHYVSLHRDSHVDVWLLCWTPENDTGWHDHDISSGAVAVLRGALTEHNLAVAQDSIRTDVVAGEGVRLRTGSHPPPDRPGSGQRLGARLLAAAVADGPVHPGAGRAAPAPGGVLRRRVAAAGLTLVRANVSD